jgi:hypothetical protein
MQLRQRCFRKAPAAPAVFDPSALPGPSRATKSSRDSPLRPRRCSHCARHIGFVAQRGLSFRQCQHRLSHGAVFHPWNPPSERQGLMNHVAPHLSESGPLSASLDSITAACAHPRCIPEASGGPFPASLSSRPPASAPVEPGQRISTAYWSSGLNDETHADRRHTRGRNPRCGAGR